MGRNRVIWREKSAEANCFAGAAFGTREDVESATKPLTRHAPVGERAGAQPLLSGAASVKAWISLSFRGAAGDEESRSELKTLRARFLAEFTLSAQSEILRCAQDYSEGLGMTA